MESDSRPKASIDGPVLVPMIGAVIGMVATQDGIGSDIGLMVGFPVGLAWMWRKQTSLTELTATALLVNAIAGMWVLAGGHGVLFVLDACYLAVLSSVVIVRRSGRIRIPQPTLAELAAIPFFLLMFHGFQFPAVSA